MAKSSKVKDILENSPFALKFSDIYAGRMTAKDIIKESGLPAWFIYDLFNQGILSENQTITMNQLNIILTAIFCYNNPLFIKNSFRNLNKTKRAAILKPIKDTTPIRWLKSRIENKINQHERVESKVLLEEMFHFYPQLSFQESRNMTRLKKVIINYKKYYRRKLSRGS